MSILAKREQLNNELFAHDYFFEHFTTARGIIYREDRKRIVRIYYEKFGEIPLYAITNFFPEILLKHLCEDPTIVLHVQILEEIRRFVESDTEGFFLQSEGRTNTYRGEFSIPFYAALVKGDTKTMAMVIKKAKEFEHLFEKKF